MEVPKLAKIVINMGVGEAKENAKVLDAAVSDLETITGQKAVLTLSLIHISSSDNKDILSYIDIEVTHIRGINIPTGSWCSTYINCARINSAKCGVPL